MRRLNSNNETTVTFKLFPRTLNLCLLVTVSGKLKHGGKPNKEEISWGVKYLSFNNASSASSPDFENNLNASSRSSLLPEDWITLPVPSQYLQNMTDERDCAEIYADQLDKPKVSGGKTTA